MSSYTVFINKYLARFTNNYFDYLYVEIKMRGLLNDCLL